MIMHCWRLAQKLWLHLWTRDALELVALLATVGGAWCFLEIADEVNEGSTQRLDEWAVRVLRHPGDEGNPVGPGWLVEVVRDVTALGGITVLVLISGAVAGYLWIRRNYRLVWLMLASALGGLFFSELLKAVFRRPRPDVTLHLLHVGSSTSFPSGHTMNSAIVYLSLGFLLAQVTRQVRLRVYYLAVAVSLTILVGMSRVFLGVHYPTDVLGGWTAGAAWACACWLVSRALLRQGAIHTLE